MFDAWTTPAQFAAFFGGSANQVPVESVSLDARPGGTWTATMIVGDDIPEFNWRGEYVDVRRPNRLVLTLTDGPGDERELLTADFKAVAADTEIRFSQTGGNLTDEQYEYAAAGRRAAFEALDALLAG
ncbi:SRPBCC domain-containing protein [Gordonia sp. NPDC127522]|uniref:SRPBCC family protein n=1 Tax=Gordonia sp. NPDC127522 TaxID=3345390 RepID=UPI00362E316F